MRRVLDSIEAEYRRHKLLAEGAIGQLSETELCHRSSVTGNSVATIVWHIAGNLESRFSDFLTTDGEKPWRHRDTEFDRREVSRETLQEKWETGWTVLFESLGALDDGNLDQVVTIRGVEHTVLAALHRSLAHASYHVGQLVFLAKEIRGKHWRYLSIPPGGTEAYNKNPIREKPRGKLES